MITSLQCCSKKKISKLAEYQAAAAAEEEIQKIQNDKNMACYRGRATVMVIVRFIPEPDDDARARAKGAVFDCNADMTV